jgi:glutathione S-transferase
MLQFIYHPTCPFAHRTWFALEHLKIEYDGKVTSISPGQKEPWFTALYKTALGADESSDGKVPVIVDGDFVLSESAVITEYVATRAGAVNFMPSGKDKAKSTIFLEQVFPKVLMGFYALLKAQDVESQEALKTSLLSALKKVSKVMAETSEGPYFLGNHITFVDAIIWPFFARFGVLRVFRNFEIPATSEYERLNAFITAISSTDAAKKTQLAEEAYVTAYTPYAHGERK